MGCAYVRVYACVCVGRMESVEVGDPVSEVRKNGTRKVAVARELL